MVVDIAPFRLETARKLGAEHCCAATTVDPVEFVLEKTSGLGPDCVIERVGHYHELPQREAPLAQAVKMIRNGGRIVTVGLGEQLTSVHFKTLVIKEAEIIASRVVAGEYSRALRMMGKGLLHPELLITHESPFEEVAGAFAKVDTQAPDVIKIVLDLGTQYSLVDVTRWQPNSAQGRVFGRACFLPSLEQEWLDRYSSSSSSLRAPSTSGSLSGASSMNFSRCSRAALLSPALTRIRPSM